MDGQKKKEKRKIENRSEKRTSVIHTDSVVMKEIEAFMIYRAYGRRSFYFLMGRAVRKGVSICFVHMTSQWGRQHVFPSTGPGMELRTAFLLFPKTYTSCPGYHIRRATTCFPVHCPYLKADAHLVVSLFSLQKISIIAERRKYK